MSEEDTYYYDSSTEKWVSSSELRGMTLYPTSSGWTVTGDVGPRKYRGSGETPEAARLACIAAACVGEASK